LDKQEIEWIEGCKKQDAASQKALYHKFCGRMMMVCLRYSKSVQEAEDILQEGFIKVFQHIRHFRGEAQLSTWITRIMVNTALNAQRKKLYMMPMVDVDQAGLTEAETISLSDFNVKDLLKMIQSLPDGCRVIFNMYAIEGYTHKEIGEMLGVSEGTSKSQYARARTLLMQILMKEEQTYYGKFK
jgi:RNA polymerase sigma factor (sigma-70 family)